MIPEASLIKLLGTISDVCGDGSVGSERSDGVKRTNELGSDLTLNLRQ
jgi:hypothetical protein